MTTAAKAPGHGIEARAETRATEPRAVDWSWLARAAVIVLAGFWIYAPVLRGEWVWDDTLLVSENKVIHDPAGLWKIWFQPGCMYDYQPLKFSLVWLEWQLWGDAPLYHHVTNVVLHVLSALLVWRLLQKLGLRLAWLGGLIFAVHPLQVESVAWISELKNTLSLPPFLLAMCAYLDFDGRARRRDYALALAWFLVAMLCKTTMAMFPFVILLYAWYRRGRVTWRDVLASAPFLMISLMLGLVTMAFQPVQPQSALVQAAVVGFSVKLILTGLLVWFFVGKFLWPIPLSATYPAWNFDPGSLLSYVPWLALIAALAGAWHWRATWGRGALLGLGFFLVNLVPPVAFLVGHFPHVVFSLDHLVYLPMLGLIGLVVAALGKVDEKSVGWSRLAWILPVATAVVLMVVESRAYAAVFAQAKTLWTYTLHYDPNSLPAHMELGEALSKEGKAAEAAEQYRIALQIAPYYAKAHYNLANKLVQLGQNEDALAQYDQAVKFNPKMRQAFINYGLLLGKMGRQAEAIDQLQQAVELEPDDMEGHMVLGDHLRDAGRLDEAIDEFRKAAELAPTISAPHSRLASIYMSQGRVPDAQEESDEALQLKPDDADAYFVRGILALYSGNNDEAADSFGKAIQFDPQRADAHFRRGTVLQMRGNLPQALADLQEGCRLAPKDSLANYARLSIWVLETQQGRKADADRDLAAAMANSWNGASKDWVAVLGRFLLGQVKESDLMAAASGSSSAGVLTCEAWYFSGMKSLGDGDKAGAMADLRKCVATGQENSIKFKLAQAELAALGGS